MRAKRVEVLELPLSARFEFIIRLLGGTSQGLLDCFLRGKPAQRALGACEEFLIDSHFNGYGCAYCLLVVLLAQ